MKKAMENLRWVAYEEYSYKDDESDEEEVRANDLSDSSETDNKTDEEVSTPNSQVAHDDGSESAESGEEG